MNGDGSRLLATGWRGKRIVTAVLIGVAMASLPQTRTWEIARPKYEWAFPRDHWSHKGFRTEWWYASGHLTDATDSSKQFAYQFTLFRIGLTVDSSANQSEWYASELAMGHAAITDVRRGVHVFSETLYRAAPMLASFGPPGQSPVGRILGPAGTPRPWQIDWQESTVSVTMADDDRGIAFDLELRPTKPIVFHGPNGYSVKTADSAAASMYYSIPRLSTIGRLRVNGNTMSVRGESWLDREFASGQLAAHHSGWDWFSVTLEDGHDVMIYLLRNRAGQVDFAHATIIDPDGSPKYLATDDWSVRATDTWRSATTTAVYPSSWWISIPSADLSFQLSPLVADQENVSNLVPKLAYWEGAVVARDSTGTEIGRGFVELTGYGDTTRPAL